LELKMKTTILMVLAAYAAVGLWLVIDTVRAHYPMMLKRRGRWRPHWSAWADIACWPLWMVACGSSWIAHRMGDIADATMRKADSWGENLMNPLFDIIDPPIEPKRGGGS
jgi:hypothetical protein